MVRAAAPAPLVTGSPFVEGGDIAARGTPAVWQTTQPHRPGRITKGEAKDPISGDPIADYEYLLKQ
jgi:hypothetical protein